MTSAEIIVSRHGDAEVDVIAWVLEDGARGPVHLTVGRAVLEPAGDRQPEMWRAYLWPSAGVRPDDEERRCERVRCETPGGLEQALNDRLAYGRWWR